MIGKQIDEEVNWDDDNLVGIPGNIKLSEQEKRHTKAIIDATIAGKTEDEIRIMQLEFLGIEMQSYLNESVEKIIPIGEWIVWYINALDIKNKTFAKYLNIKEPNLSAILKNRRKVNIDFALKLEQLFNVKAEVWLGIQLKNELVQVEKKGEKEYKIEELMKLSA